MPAPELELQVLDREVRRAHDDEGADENDREVDAVHDQPAAEQPRIPAQVAHAEALERERDARQRRHAVGEHHQRAKQLARARLHRLPVLRADDVERAQRALDQRVGDADGGEGEDEREQRGGDDGERARQHYRRLITRPRATSCWPMSVPAESTFSPMSVHTGITPQ